MYQAAKAVEAKSAQLAERGRRTLVRSSMLEGVTACSALPSRSPRGERATSAAAMARLRGMGK